MRKIIATLSLVSLLMFSGCITPDPTDEPTRPYIVQNVNEIVGWGNENYWTKINPHDLCKKLVENGCTATHIEFLASSEFNYQTNPSALVPIYKEFLKETRNHKILLIVNIVNWNSDYLSKSQYNDAWFNSLLDIICNEGTEGVCLQHASEWDDARNNNVKDKAIRWEKMFLAKWTGLKSYNRGSRPSSIPAGYNMREYHCWSITGHGQKNVNIVSDTEKAITEVCGNLNDFYVKNLDKLMRGTKEAKANNDGFIWYGYGNPPNAYNIDNQAIEVIGNAWR